MANNQFLVSVANAIVRDPNSGSAIAYGTTNLTSAFTLTTQKTDVRGGINNPLLYTYIHDRTVEVKIEEATFDKVYLGLNVGDLVENGSVSVTQTDCITLSSGSGVLSGSATTDPVNLFLSDGTIAVVTPVSGSVFFYAAGSSTMVTAVYKTMVASDQITVQTITPPSVVDLTLIGEVRDNTGVIIEYLQINIPRFQVSGNYTLSFAANGVSTQALDGYALETASTDCTSGAYYAKVTWVPA